MLFLQQTLCFRRNLIIKIEGLDRLVTLQELDLYDNQIEKIENLEKLTNLKYRKLIYFVRHAVDMIVYYLLLVLSSHGKGIIFYRNLDLSFNAIKVMENLTALVELEELYLIQNNISKIDSLTMLSSLTTLELGANKIRVCFIRNDASYLHIWYRTVLLID